MDTYISINNQVDNLIKIKRKTNYLNYLNQRDIKVYKLNEFDKHHLSENIPYEIEKIEKRGKYYIVKIKDTPIYLWNNSIFQEIFEGTKQFKLIKYRVNNEDRVFIEEVK